MISVSQMDVFSPPQMPNQGEMYILTDKEDLVGDFKKFEPLDLVQYSDRWIKIEVPFGTLVRCNFDGSHFKLVPKDGKKWLAVKL